MPIATCAVSPQKAKTEDKQKKHTKKVCICKSTGTSRKTSGVEVKKAEIPGKSVLRKIMRKKKEEDALRKKKKKQDNDDVRKDQRRGPIHESLGNTTL